MGTLYIVGTPIGNLEDITLRALRILREVDAIACEDTRHTGAMLAHFEIKKPLIRCDEHINYGQMAKIAQLLEKGQNIAFVSDAGTPGISDPGARLTKEAITNNINVVPIPGVSAITTLYSVVGISESNFLFLGFLPKKKGRQTLLRRVEELVASNKERLPIIIYESPYRVVRTLEDFKAIGKWDVIVGRELTKKFEEIIRGTIEEVLKYFRENPKKLRGEFSICLINRE